MLRRAALGVKGASVLSGELPFVEGQIVDGDTLGVVIEDENPCDVGQARIAGKTIMFLAKIRDPDAGDFRAVTTQEHHSHRSVFTTAQIKGECCLIGVEFDRDGPFTDRFGIGKSSRAVTMDNSGAGQAHRAKRGTGRARNNGKGCNCDACDFVVITIWHKGLSREPFAETGAGPNQKVINRVPQTERALDIIKGDNMGQPQRVARDQTDWQSASGGRVSRQRNRRAQKREPSSAGQFEQRSDGPKHVQTISNLPKIARI